MSRIGHEKLNHLLVALGLLLVAFSVPLYQLASFASGSKLYSHILIVPFVAFYFAWTRQRIPPGPSKPLRATGLFFGVLGVILAFVAWQLNAAETMVPQEDYLAAVVASLLCFCYGACAWFLDLTTLRRLFFPLAFLVFMIPLPVMMQEWLETFLQHGSALAALGFFKVYGTPVLVDGLNFDLPGFRMHVAPECSGIHSSVVLFIVSIGASHLFLNTTWKRVVLVLAVIPLALLRNGLRIFVIGQLCVDVGPHMIDSYIHRRGGPIFFALSLVPLFLLLAFLWRSERRKPRGPVDPAGGLASASEARAP